LCTRTDAHANGGPSANTSAIGGRRLRYTIEEDEAIIEYARKAANMTSGKGSIGGNLFWKQAMADNVGARWPNEPNDMRNVAKYDSPLTPHRLRESRCIACHCDHLWADGSRSHHIVGSRCVTGTAKL